MRPEIEFPIESQERAQGMSSFHRLLTLLVGLVAVLASVLGTIEAAALKGQERALADAHYNAQLVTGQTTTYIQLAFEDGLVRELNGFGLEGLSSVVDPAVLDQRGSGMELVRAIERADVATKARLNEIRDRIWGVPEDLDELGRDLLAPPIQQSDNPYFAGRQEALELAEAHGHREERTMLALSMTISAGVLLGMAGLIGASRAAWISTWAAIAVLAGAAAVGASVIAT